MPSARPEPLEVLLVRHAHPAEPPPGAERWPDPGLTEEGLVQAEVVARRLVHDGIDRVYSSPLRRAVESAEPLARRLGVEVRILPGLAEADAYAPEATYVRIEELRDDPEAFRRFLDDPIAFLGADRETFLAAVEGAYAQMAADGPGRAAAFTHGLPLNWAIARALGHERLTTFPPAYTSITKVVLTGDRVRVVSINDTGHALRSAAMTPSRQAELEPDRPAVVDEDGTVMTYAALERESIALGHVLRARGLRAGDHVALLLGNEPAFFVAAWAAQRLGLRWTPVSWHLKAGEIAHVLTDSGARALITAHGFEGLAGEALDAAPVEHVLGFGASGPGIEAVEPLMAAAPGRPLDEEAEGADMLYTSGTTGRPKGVVTPSAGGPFGSDARRAERLRELFAMEPGDVLLVPAPLHHAAPLRFAMAVHRLGGTVVVMRRFDALRALALIERERVTHSQWVPTHFVRLLALDPSDRARFDLRTHRVAIHAGAPCPVDVKHAMLDWWGPILHEYYAGTESLGLVHCTSEEWLARPGTVGRPWRCALHVVDDATGRELGPGETGTVYFESPRRLEYHNAPEHTAASTLENGWATMGDVGHVDGDGYLFLTDRRAFTIVTGGVNVYPREVEDVLRGHPAVADVAVLGLPDAEFGERVTAVVVPEAAHADEPDLPEALVAFCREHLSHVKCPRSVELRDALPLTGSGKVAKAELRDELVRAAGQVAP